MVDDSRKRENIRLADRVSDAGANGGRQLGRQLIKVAMRLNEQMQGTELLEYPAGPADAGELSRDWSQHASNPGCLRVHQARSHRVEVGVTGSIQASDATAYLIAKPLVELLEPGGYAIRSRSGPLGSGGRIDEFTTLPCSTTGFWLCLPRCPCFQPCGGDRRWLADGH
jgi:hypothetical protein